jgi:hypothetical protein
MWQKGSAARVRDEAAFDFQKKNILIGSFIRLSGSRLLEFLGTDIMQPRTVM